MLLDDMGLWLQQGEVGTLAATSGTSIMLGGLDDLPSRQVALIELTGLAPLHSGAGKVSRPRMRALCRAEDYVSARELAQAAADRLDTIVNTIVGSTYYLRVENIMDPYDAGRDSSGRFLIAADFQVWRDD